MSNFTPFFPLSFRIALTKTWMPFSGVIRVTTPTRTAVLGLSEKSSVLSVSTSSRDA